MSAELQTRPSRTITVGATNFESRWNAAWNTIMYHFIRKDRALLSTTYTGSGNIDARISGGDYTTEYQVGDTVYIKTGNEDYKGTGTVTFSAYNAGLNRTTVTIETFADNGADTGGFLNNTSRRANYYLEVKIYKASSNELLDTIRIYGDSEWNLKAKIETILRAELSGKDTINYDVVNATDGNKSVEFYIKYAEKWDSSAESETDDSANTYYATYSALQIQDAYAGNMAAYVLMSEDYLASKFLTMFEKPAYWPGYPWDIAFILDKNVDSLLGGSPLQVLAKTEHVKDVNGSTIQTEIILLDDTSGFIHRLMLEGGYPSNGATINLFVGIEDGSDLGLYVDPGYVAPGYVGSGTPESDSSNRLTELKVIDVKSVCDNPVYLKWINPLGGYDQWLFDRKQVYDLKTEASDLFTNVIDNWETAEEVHEYIRKTGAQAVTLGANNLTTQQVDGIKWIYTSPKVYEMQTDNSRLTVLVAPGTFKIKDTSKDRHDIEFTILYPELNVQNN